MTIRIEVNMEEMRRWIADQVGQKLDRDVNPGHVTITSCLPDGSWVVCPARAVVEVDAE
jgi:hypothetical protein